MPRKPTGRRPGRQWEGTNRSLRVPPIVDLAAEELMRRDPEQMRTRSHALRALLFRGVETWPGTLLRQERASGEEEKA